MNARSILEDLAGSPSQSFGGWEHLDFVLPQVMAEGHIMEFGVFRGQTLRRISKAFPDDRTVWGFDSFQGLPEPWHISPSNVYPAGHFRDVGVLSYGAYPNVVLVKGFFEETLPRWKEENAGPAAFLNVDSDLYSSCRTILWELDERIIPGTIIRFDELVDWDLLRGTASSKSPYVNWREGEFKALDEWLSGCEREVVAHSWDQRYGAAVRVTR